MSDKSKKNTKGYNPNLVEQGKQFTSETGRAAGKKSKRGRSLKAILRETLNTEISLKTLGGRRANAKALKNFLAEKGYRDTDKIPIADVLVLADVIDAVRGTDKSRQRVYEYMEGKPIQATLELDAEPVVAVDMCGEDIEGEVEES